MFLFVFLLRRYVREVERRRSLRKSLCPLASSAGFAFDGSAVPEVSEGSQKRLVTLWFAGSGAGDEWRHVGSLMQEGELLLERTFVKA